MSTFEQENPKNLAPEKVCDGCGRFGAYAFADQWLCLDCYGTAGACCAAEQEEKD